MAIDIFKDSTKSVPRRDPAIVRVPMTENEIGGRKDHMPAHEKGGNMSIQHVPNATAKE